MTTKKKRATDARPASADDRFVPTTRRKLTPLLKTAYHEAGHVVLAWIVGIDFGSATIVSEGKFKGRLNLRLPPNWDDESVPIPDRARMRQNLVLMYLAGPIAQEMIAEVSTGRRCYRGSSQDFETAAMLAGSMFTGDDYREFVKGEVASVKAMLTKAWYIVASVASRLIKDRTVGRAELLDEIIAAIGREPL